MDFRVSFKIRHSESLMGESEVLVCEYTDLFSFQKPCCITVVVILLLINYDHRFKIKRGLVLTWL